MSAHAIDSQLIQVSGTPLEASAFSDALRRGLFACLGLGAGLCLLAVVPVLASIGLLLALVGGPRFALQGFTAAFLFLVALLIRPRD